MAEINDQTLIDKGLPLSRNFLLDHLTSGSYHPVFAQWIPEFSAVLNPHQRNAFLSVRNIPIWRVARNLQITADRILEPLLREFGGILRVKAGFLNNIPTNIVPREAQHLLGLSIDIGLHGFEDNMYNVAQDIQRIAKRASSMSLVFGNSSWIHLDVDPHKALQNSLRFELPEIVSVDLISGVTERGMQPFRGFL